MACVQFAELCYIAGDTVNIDFQYLENDGVTPIDLTGATAEMQLLLGIDDAAATDDLNGGITVPTNGQGRFSLTAVESQALLPIVTGNILIDFISHMRFTFADTTVRTVAGANLEFKQTLIR
jgi:hypothetical protein